MRRLFENAIWGILDPVWNPGAVESFDVSVGPPVAAFELAGEGEKGVTIPVLDIVSH